MGFVFARMLCMFNLENLQSIQITVNMVLENSKDLTVWLDGPNSFNYPLYCIYMGAGATASFVQS